MCAWYRVVVAILSCIVLDAYSSNNCNYYNNHIYCNGNLDIMPILNDNLTEYKGVCIYLIYYNYLLDTNIL